MFEIEQLTADMNLEEFKEKYVNFDKNLELCKDCDSYAKNWSCPPFNFNPDEIWDSFERIKIIAFKFNFSEELIEKEFNEEELEIFLKRLQRTKVKLMNVIYNMEDANSLGLGIGECALCVKCTREFGMPCKMPFKLRYSIEALGGNVDQMIKDVFDVDILYAKDGKLPDYMIFVGGLLYDKK